MQDIELRNIEPALIDYQALMDSATEEELVDVRTFLETVLPNEWIWAYKDMSPHQHNILEVPDRDHNLKYLWDQSYELVSRGEVSATKFVDERIVAAHGVSRKATEQRSQSRMKGYSTGPIGFVGSPSDFPAVDKGHLIGHAQGGMMDLNIFPQVRKMNRGGEWREREIYCASNPGTYFFCRPIYLGYSRHPAEIEFGILKPDNHLDVVMFRNYDDISQLIEIERIWLEKIASQ